MKKTITIGGKKIGHGEPVLVVAELSGNHNQRLSRALRLIDEAKKAGADAVKLQTYTPDTITLDSSEKPFVVTWQGKRRTLYDLYKEAMTPWEWHTALFARAKKHGMVVFSTPFDSSAVAFLEKLKVPCYKVASFEVVDIPLLKAIGKTRKPVILSRGMATKRELDLAVRTLREAGSTEIVVLQCTSAYPARVEDMRLSMIPELSKRFKTLAGLSDHTMGIEAPVAATALGATVIEKHLTLRRADGGPDAAFSLEPKEFADMVRAVRRTEGALGSVSYARPRDEHKNVSFRKSVFVVADVAKGERLSAHSIRVIRPGYGMEPKYYEWALGRRAKRALKRGAPLRKTDIV